MTLLTRLAVEVMLLLLVGTFTTFAILGMTFWGASETTFPVISLLSLPVTVNTFPASNFLSPLNGINFIFLLPMFKKLPFGSSFSWFKLTIFCIGRAARLLTLVTIGRGGPTELTLFVTVKGDDDVVLWEMITGDDSVFVVVLIIIFKGDDFVFAMALLIIFTGDFCVIVVSTDVVDISVIDVGLSFGASEIISSPSDIAYLMTSLAREPSSS